MIDDLGTGMDPTPVIAEQPDPLLFATVSGAHLYGFPSQDSDLDLRGAHLMRSGEVRAHLPTLLDHVDAPSYLPELIAAKAEREHGPADVGHARVAADVEHLHTMLDDAQSASPLPDAHTAHDALHDFVVRVRLD
ncbi:DNA polymerase beta superfamily protein [Streptomyces bungoensis]|uniref:DNA polymerase beta superfamily protein n=1 Tax=Streptomyces bungoensis TaxID=285568 RepID=UPI0033F60BFF